MSKETGGPAFPIGVLDISRKKSYLDGGMTLRDYFAGQALKGILSDATHLNTIAQRVTKGGVPDLFEGVAKVACQYADAMIAERNK